MEDVYTKISVRMFMGLYASEDMDCNGCFFLQEMEHILSRPIESIVYFDLVPLSERELSLPPHRFGSRKLAE